MLQFCHFSAVTDPYPNPEEITENAENDTFSTKFSTFSWIFPFSALFRPFWPLFAKFSTPPRFYGSDPFWEQNLQWIPTGTPKTAKSAVNPHWNPENSQFCSESPLEPQPGPILQWIPTGTTARDPFVVYVWGNHSPGPICRVCLRKPAPGPVPRVPPSNAPSPPPTTPGTTPGTTPPCHTTTPYTSMAQHTPPHGFTRLHSDCTGSQDSHFGENHCFWWKITVLGWNTTVLYPGFRLKYHCFIPGF